MEKASLRKHSIQTPVLALTIPTALGPSTLAFWMSSSPICELRKSSMDLSRDVPVVISGRRDLELSSEKTFRGYVNSKKLQEKMGSVGI